MKIQKRGLSGRRKGIKKGGQKGKYKTGKKREGNRKKRDRYLREWEGACREDKRTIEGMGRKGG